MPAAALPEPTEPAAPDADAPEYRLPTGNAGHTVRAGTRATGRAGMMPPPTVQAEKAADAAINLHSLHMISGAGQTAGPCFQDKRSNRHLAAS